MQKYKEINGNDYVKDSRTTINETMQSIQSMNSGTAFPTNNLFEGMKCYRTDLKKTYTLTDVENNTWVEDAHAEQADEATHAASATKLQTARSLNLGGAVTADAATFDGTADTTINVKTLDASKLKGTAPVSTTGNAATATKLATARTIALGGNASGSTTFDGSGDVTINATVNESAHAATATKVVTTAAAGASANIAEATMAGSDYARIRVSGNSDACELALETADNGNEPIVARQYTGIYANVARTAKILDESGNTSFPGTVVAPKFTGTLNGNAATASKLATPRTLSLTGKATGSTSFDGSANASINVTSVNADTATKLSTARKINITGNASGSATFDGSGDISISTTVNESKHAVNADTAAHANDVTDAVIKYGVSGTDEKFTAAASGVIGHLKDLTGSTDLTSMNKLRSYIGSVFNETNWFDVLSIRHRNGAADGPNFGLLMYSNLTNTDSIKYKKQTDGNGWTEERTLLDSSNYNSYAPTKTGVGASGTWPISVSGNAATATKAAACSGNSATATKLATPRTISLTGNASGSANFDGSGNVSINTTVSQAANADKIDGYHENSFLRYRGDAAATGEDTYWSQIGIKRYEGKLPKGVSGTYNYGGVVSLPAGAGARLDIWYNHTCSTNGDGLWYRSGYDTDKQAWARLLDTVNYTKWVPTKTGSGASGTWGINISGTATNADKLDGYHASDIINKITAANAGGIVAASLTENGYAKFANGLILQWGFVINTKPTTSYNVTFPVSFASACYGVHSTFFNPSGKSGASGGEQHDTVGYITKTGCQLDADNQSVFWTAIGV